MILQMVLPHHKLVLIKTNSNIMNKMGKIEEKIIKMMMEEFWTTKMMMMMMIFRI